MVRKIEKANYFVTGGAGFIGSHLAGILAANGSKVTVYDNLVTGSRDNLKPLLGKDNFTLVNADILDPASLTAAMQGHDIVWHLAGNTDINKGNRITDLDLKNCTTGTRNVLEAMRSNHIDKILFSSSACVYGDGAPVALSETFGPLLPINLYGAGKLACEGLLSAYSHLFGIKVWMFRFANVVGSGMGHGVIFDFIQKLKKNPTELEILGDGNQEKPFFMVEDCIDGMICAFQNSGTQCDVFNLGTGEVTTVTRIGEIVIQEMALKNVKVRYTGGRRGWPGDAPVIHFDVNKMKKLGWQATHSSDEAVHLAARRILGI